MHTGVLYILGSGGLIRTSFSTCMLSMDGWIGTRCLLQLSVSVLSVPNTKRLHISDTTAEPNMTFCRHGSRKEYKTGMKDC